MNDKIKMSHSIHMLCIQIDTKWSIQQNKNVLLCKPYETELSILYIRKVLYDY